MFTSFSHYANSSNAIVSVTFGRPRLTTVPPSPNVPLVSSGSLQFHFLAASNKANLYLSTTQGWTSYRIGEVRSLVQSFEETPTNGTYGFGLYVLGNQTDLATSNSGTCYMVVLDLVAGTRRLWIGKSPNSGANQSAATVLSMLSAGGWSNQAAPLGLSIQYRVSAAAATIIVQTAVSATAADPFTGLSTILSATDTSAPLLSNVAAGPWAHNATASGLHVFFDSTEWRQRF